MILLSVTRSWARAYIPRSLKWLPGSWLAQAPTSVLQKPLPPGLQLSKPHWEAARGLGRRNIQQTLTWLPPYLGFLAFVTNFSIFLRKIPPYLLSGW